MLIIDEVSFLGEDNLRKLDKYMRKLKEKDVMYGGVHLIFVRYFFQMLPVRGKPLFKNNTIQFGAINRAVFLNVSHRFSKDPLYGEVMRHFRIGEVAKEDISLLNSRYCEESTVTLPPVPKLRCVCYTNDKRNAYNNVVYSSNSR